MAVSHPNSRSLRGRNAIGTQPCSHSNLTLHCASAINVLQLLKQLVHVDWAPMVEQRQRFAEFRFEFQVRYPKRNLAFRYIDCTPIANRYKPLRTLPGWKELEERNNGSSLVHGYGEIVWFKNGRVLHVENPLNFDSADALIEKTELLGMVDTAE